MSEITKNAVKAVAETQKQETPRFKTIGASESPILMSQMTLEDNQDEAEENSEFQFESQQTPVSPYGSVFQLAMMKTGQYQVSRKTESSRQKMGRLLEPVIINYIVSEKGWKSEKPEKYYIHPKIQRMGAQIDHFVYIDDKRYPLEIKLVNENEKWKWINEANNKIVPPHIQIQIQHQMSVLGVDKGFIGVCFGTDHIEIFEIERNEDLIQEIESAVIEFWECLDQGLMPKPDPVRDRKIINKLFTQITPKGSLDWTEDQNIQNIITQWRQKASIESQAKKEKDELANQLKDLLRGHEMAKVGNGIILKFSIVEACEIPKSRREAYTKLTLCKEPKRSSKIR